MGNFEDAKQPQTLNKIYPQGKDFHRAIICVWSEIIRLTFASTTFYCYNQMKHVPTCKLECIPQQQEPSKASVIHLERIINLKGLT